MQSRNKEKRGQAAPQQKKMESESGKNNKRWNPFNSYKLMAPRRNLETH